MPLRDLTLSDKLSAGTLVALLAALFIGSAALQRRAGDEAARAHRLAEEHQQLAMQARQAREPVQGAQRQLESLGLPDDLSQVRALSAQLRTATADWRRLQQGVEAVGGDVTAGIALEAVAQARVQLQVTLRHLDEQTILGTAISRDVLVKHSLIPELNAYDHALARFAALQSRQGEQALEAAERERGGSWWVGLSALLCLALSAAVAMSLMARRMRPASPIGPTTLSRPAMLAATSPVGPVVREDGDEQSSDHHLGWALNVHAPQVGPVPYGSTPLTGHGVQHAGGIAGMGGPFAPRPTAGVGEQG